MSKPKLVLSNTTTFFSGNIESIFKKAKKHGFDYLELVPYRWTHPEEVLALQDKYQIQIAGIHLPEWWNQTFWEAFFNRPGPVKKLLSFVWAFYLGSSKYSPAWTLAKLLKTRGQDPYILFHTNVALRAGQSFKQIAENFHVVAENIPYRKNASEFLWNPVTIEKNLAELTGEKRLVFDPGHFEETLKQKPELDILKTYKQIQPEIIHIGYNDYSPFFHTPPTKKSQKELVHMLRLHSPKYIVIETNPLVNVKKTKVLIENIVAKALG